METKSLLVGAALLLVGVILGFGVSTISANSKQPYYPKYEKKYKKEFSQCHYNGDKRKGMKSKQGRNNFNYANYGQLQKIMTEELSLSAEQQEKIDALFAKQAEMREAHQTKMRAEREARQQIRIAEREKMHDEIYKILDDSQGEIFKKIVENYCNRQSGNKGRAFKNR
ncbi:MAG: hypothetical protein M0R02_02385 [Bacteroidales bacterium]|nr:hypothetical protein [Bacteroidales bacterium]NLK80666.1 hypothetical protein [Bacteroidales bacterium]